MTPKPPPPPDPVATASAQTGMNIGTAVANAYLNNVNQVTPDHYLKYTTSGHTTWKDPVSGKTYQIPNFTVHQQLSPVNQAIKRAGDRAKLGMASLAANQANRLNHLLARPMSMEGMPDMPGVPGHYGYSDFQGFDNFQYDYNTDFSADRQRVEDALMERMNPHLERDREALRTQLSNQGIKLGSEAYDRGMSDFSRQSNDARLGAILSAGQEQSRLVGLARDHAMFTNDARQQAFENYFRAQGANNQLQDQRFNQDQARFAMGMDQRKQALAEMFQMRNQPINEISALMSGSQIAPPAYAPTNNYGIPTTDYAGIVQDNYARQVDIWKQRAANRQALMGGLFSMAGDLGGAAIGAWG